MNPRTPTANGTSRLDVASPGVNFLMKSDTVVLIMTGSPTRAIHGADRLTRTSCPLSPCLSTLFEKISPPPDKHLRKDIPFTVGVLFTDSAKIHRITENSGINVWGVNNFLHNCRKDLKQRNCFFYRTFFYSISTIFISLRPF